MTYVHLRYLNEFLEWEMFQTKKCRENQNAHFMFKNFISKNCAV